MHLDGSQGREGQLKIEVEWNKIPCHHSSPRSQCHFLGCRIFSKSVSHTTANGGAAINIQHFRPTLARWFELALHPSSLPAIEIIRTNNHWEAIQEWHRTLHCINIICVILAYCMYALLTLSILLLPTMDQLEPSGKRSSAIWTDLLSPQTLQQRGIPLWDEGYLHGETRNGK